MMTWESAAATAAALAIGLVLCHRIRPSSPTADQVAQKWSSGLDGKVVAITGCNSGLGKETTRAILAHTRPRCVVLLCRSATNAEATKKELAHLAVGAETEIIAEECDLASLDAIAKSVARLVATKVTIDITICNAGVATVPDFKKTKDGHELQFGVNFLGHFLLAKLLMRARKKGMRFVLVSSGAYVGTKELDVDDLSCEKTPYHLFTAYSRSKLCNILHAQALRARGVEAYVVDPGTVVSTNVARHLSPWMQRLFRIVMMFSTKTVAQGAASSVYCAAASSTQLCKHENSIVVDCVPKKLTALARDMQKAEDLWAKAEHICAEFC